MAHSRTLMFLVLTALLVSPSRAEPVYLAAATGPNAIAREGQGWTFRGPSGGCWIVTAAHVVDGATSITAVGSAGRRGFGRDFRRHADPDVDIAFVPIEGDLANPCSGPVYGYADVGPVLSGLSRSPGGMRLERMHEGGQRSVFEASLAGNENDGIHFVVRLPPSEDLTISRGMSGTPVRLAGSGTETGLPIGIVIEALNDGETGVAVEAAAVRMDVVRRFIERDLVPIAAQRDDTLDLEIVDATPARDVGCGPINALVGEPACGWRPDSVPWSRIVLGLGDRPISQPSIRVRFAPGAAPENMLIRTSQADAPPQWGVAVGCQVSGQLDVICRKNDAAVRVIRIDFEGEEIEVVGILISGDAD